MKMKRMVFIWGMVFALGLFAGSLKAQVRYEVTVTNLTKGQVITPPVVFSHFSGIEIFREGERARTALVALAETGATDPLVDLLKTHDRVYDVNTGSGVIPPGESLTVELMVYEQYNKVTAVGMLAQTNDCFFGIKGVEAPCREEIVVYANAYDAGSEENNELAAYIPGPPFMGMLRSPKYSEKYIYIHPGIQGIGDLTPSMYDWKNPVAKIVIRLAD